jgi:hypothetical protein
MESTMTFQKEQPLAESRVEITANCDQSIPIPTPKKQKKKKRTKRINRTANPSIGFQDDDSEDPSSTGKQSSDSDSRRSDTLTITYNVQTMYPK